MSAMDAHDYGEAGSSRLVLIRHGEGRVNVEGIIGGLQGCNGLTDLGRQQVQALSARWAESGFRPHLLVSSPVRRARETADCLAASIPGLVVAEDCALCEIHLGEADGLTWLDYGTRYGRFDLEAEPSRPFAPGAESWAEVIARVRTCLDQLAVTHSGQTVVVVTHAGFTVASLIALLAIPISKDRVDLDPQFTSITCWHRTPERWSLVSFNDVAHLTTLRRHPSAPGWV
jgi:broad specificity phosphatase PhoE